MGRFLFPVWKKWLLIESYQCEHALLPGYEEENSLEFLKVWYIVQCKGELLISKDTGAVVQRE